MSKHAYDKIAEGLREVLEMVRRPGFAEEAQPPCHTRPQGAAPRVRT